MRLGEILSNAQANFCEVRKGTCGVVWVRRIMFVMCSECVVEEREVHVYGCVYVKRAIGSAMACIKDEVIISHRCCLSRIDFDTSDYGWVRF